MDQTVAVITPAWKAQDTIVTTVQSVLDQTWPHWELWLIADDGADYAAFLAEAGISDPRIRFLSSGGTGRGASNTRNVALEQITAPYAAILDADDRLKPSKLERAVAALADHAIVTTALDVMTDSFAHLRHVGDGPDRLLTPGEHKWVSLSMDSMLVWDRRRADGRYDPTMSNMTDLEFLLQLYRTAPASFHLGTPLHDYIKRSSSMSNGSNVAAGMIRSKTEILRRLQTGHYGLPARDVEGLVAFLTISLAAEARYAAALAAQPGLLFEDHLQPMLAAAAH
ncbi:MAG: glycosyltransferase family 2 protein [Alphaproteobacteria bacterium]|nr:glycosyltransferase family 2 protein [Alphaproteobacteria bacterium]MBU1562397.1 glycosyltransferase family 2 protein [Alphaproteobacteria bacterium]MBU2304138.1 glycosyltransferase family 2 protein [Alphaproteobacteria bacterium]MBU2369200.1 glycosyltransferase family 2 protein [Alphaproteobacteria bacterium]